MTSPILVTGGTGTLGRPLVARLLDAGAEVSVLTRGRKPVDPDARAAGVRHLTLDLATAEPPALTDALAGTGTVVHVAGGPKGDDRITAALARAAASAGVGHFVLVSVTAADLLPFGYFRAKLGAERAVAAAGMPWSVVRPAQFHDFVLMVARAACRLPVGFAPAVMRLQPVDARDAAARLAEVALGAPAGLLPEVVGPRVYEARDLFRDYLRWSGRRSPLVPVPMPGRAGRLYKENRNIFTGPDVWTGTRTWEDYLAERRPER